MHNKRHVAFLVGVALALIPVFAQAVMRVTNPKFDYICRVVVISEYGHRQRTVFDGRAGHGLIATVDGGRGNVVCYSRNVNPRDCKSRMTPWRCKENGARNFTRQLTVQ